MPDEVRAAVSGRLDAFGAANGLLARLQYASVDLSALSPTDPGNPYASPDHLASLTYGQAVRCREVDTDHYGRSVVQCFAGDADRSCAMVRNGYAIERYGWLRC